MIILGLICFGGSSLLLCAGLALLKEEGEYTNACGAFFSAGIAAYMGLYTLAAYLKGV